MKYISLYTAGALENSLNIFDKYGYYFFGFSENNKFKLEEIQKALYLGLGKKYNFSDDVNYLKIQKIGEIKKVGEFTFINNSEDFEINGINEDKENLEIAFNKHIDYFHVKDNGKIDEFIAEKWIYIFCDKENILNINEDILYGYKKLISFPINLDKNGKYINSINLIDTIKIDDNTFLNIKKDCLIVDGENIELGNYGVYGKILELLLLNDFEFNINNYNEVFKGLKKTFSFNIDDLRTSTIKGFNSKMNRFLNFEIKITSEGLISRKMK